MEAAGAVGDVEEAEVDRGSFVLWINRFMLEAYPRKRVEGPPSYVTNYSPKVTILWNHALAILVSNSFDSVSADAGAPSLSLPFKRAEGITPT